MTIEKLKEALMTSGTLATIVSSLFLLLVKSWMGGVEKRLDDVEVENRKQGVQVTEVKAKEEAHYGEVLRWLQLIDGKLDSISKPSRR